MRISLSDIAEISSLDLYSKNNTISVNSITYEDEIIGEGGFGSVYRVVELNETEPEDLLLKIIDSESSAQHALRTISVLHQKLKREQYREKTSVFNVYPELLGLPFLVFSAFDPVREKKVTGMVMLDLSTLGYEDFNADEGHSEKYENLGFQEKAFLCYRFANVIDFLHRIQFVHADLKEAALWVNPARLQVALIDFDSGYHYDVQKKAITLGAVGHWISGRFRTLLGTEENNEEVTARDRVQEEYWVLANGIFEIQFGLAPFFFLIDSEVGTREKYLGNYSWPEADLDDEIFIKENLVYQERIDQFFKEYLESDARSYLEGFIKIFNEGYSNRSSRLTAKQWKDLLYELLNDNPFKPEIVEFAADSNVIKKKDSEIQLSLKGKGFTRAFVDGKIVDFVKDQETIVLSDSKIIEFTLESDFGRVSESVKIVAEKVDPEFHLLEASSLVRYSEDPILLSWKTSHADKVQLKGYSDNLPPDGDFSVEPKQKQMYELVAVGFFDQRISQTIEIDVVRPSIESFSWEINLSEGIDSVLLKWQTRNAIEVQIEPLIGMLDLSGEKNMKIPYETEFSLIAKGLFSEAIEKVKAQPFPIPVMDSLLVPAPQFEVSIDIDARKLEVPEILSLSKPVQINEIALSLFEKPLLDDHRYLVTPEFELTNDLLNRHTTKSSIISRAMESVTKLIRRIKSKGHD